MVLRQVVNPDAIHAMRTPIVLIAWYRDGDGDVPN